MKPFFSIIIPLYNNQKYIEKTLHSCISQTFNDIEIIVIDDCGQDNSRAIVYQYTQIDKRIRFFCNPQNLGTFKTRLEGVKYTQGEYILFLDADDFIQEHTCEILYEKIENNFLHTHQYADIVCFGMNFYPKNPKRTLPKIVKKTLLNEKITKVFFLSSFEPPAHLCGKVYRASVFRTLLSHKSLKNPPRLNLYEDMVQFFFFTLFSKKSIGIGKKLYFYVENPQSITRDQERKNIQKRIKHTLYAIHFVSQIPNTNQHPFFDQAKQRILNQLRAFLCLEYRHEKSFFSYPKACLSSLKYNNSWKTYTRILFYLFSFGKVKL